MRLGVEQDISDGKPAQTKDDPTANWLTDALADVRRQISRRVGNPVIGSFALAWVFINFEVWLNVFGDKSTDNKIKALHAIQDGPDSLTKLLFAPLLIAVFFPLVEIGLAGFARWLDNLRKKVILDVEKKQPVPDEEKEVFYATLRKQAEAQREYLDRQISVNVKTAKNIATYTASINSRLKQAAREGMIRLALANKVANGHEEQYVADNWMTVGISLAELRGAASPGMGDVIASIIRSMYEHKTKVVPLVWLQSRTGMEAAQLDQLITYMMGADLVIEEYLEGDRVIRVLDEGASFGRVLRESVAEYVGLNPAERDKYAALLSG